VTDTEIMEAYAMLASLEGIFCEPASAASVAGLLPRARAGDLVPGETVVCVLTGHGLKDPDTAIVMPRSLKDPVGFMPSNLACTSTPSLSERRGSGTRGVPPSPSETIGVAALTGRKSR
jgi:threonine synthase